MTPRLLLDTHITVRWISESKRLTREQFRVLEGAVRRGEPVALSAMSLLEIAIKVGEGKLKLRATLLDFFEALEANPVFHILPVTFEIATEVYSLGNSLRDPADRTIVATARVHGLRLVTSDERILASRLVPVVE